MRMTLGLTRLLTIVLIFSAVTAQPVGAKRAKDSARVVGTDPAGDWGGGILAPETGDELGQDLTRVEIRRTDEENLAFGIRVNNLPQDATSTTSYVWLFSTDEADWLLASGACATDFFVECIPSSSPDFTLFMCEPKTVEAVTTRACTKRTAMAAEYDSTNETITIPVAISELGIETRGKIAPTVDAPSVLAYTVPPLDVSGTTTPYDELFMTKSFSIR